MLTSQGSLEGLRNRAQAKKVLDFLRKSAIIEEKVISANSAEADTEALDDAADDAADTIEATDSTEGGAE